MMLKELTILLWYVLALSEAPPFEITIYRPKKRIKPTKFWHILIIKVARNCDLPSRNKIFLTNQFSILEN